MALTDRSTHFEFGENWRDYAKLIDQSRIDRAIAGLRKLFPEGLSGKSFLDIGCGSGLHSLAALKLGARSVFAVDIDENSITTTRELLTRLAMPDWRTEIKSVFELDPSDGTFDVVYSWGVLHHTGDMWRAIDAASRLVRPGGEFALAIYAKTPMDAFWKIEKRLYSRAPWPAQWTLRQAYIAAYLAGVVACGRNPIAFMRNYTTRGMDFAHDVHDWLGGYPYETASAQEITERLTGAREQAIEVIDHFQEGAAERLDVADQLWRQILVHAADTKERCVHARARRALVEHHQLFALFETPQRRRKRTDVHRLRGDVEKMRQETADLAVENADQLAAARHLDAQQPFGRKAKGVFLVHRGDIVEPVEIRDRLQIGLMFDQFFGSAMQQTDVRIDTLDNLSIKFQHKSKYAVGRRMLGAEIDGKIANASFWHAELSAFAPAIRGCPSLTSFPGAGRRA